MTTLIDDAFARADETPLAGVYVTPASNITGTLKLVSNLVGNTSASVDSWMYDNSHTYGGDQWAEVTISAIGGRDFGAIVRMSTAGSGYYVTNGADITKLSLFKVVSGAFGAAVVEQVGVYLANDVIYIEVQGTTVVVKQNGSTVLTFNDVSSPLSAGKAGLGGFDGTWRVSRFRAGDFTTGPTITAQPQDAASYTDLTANFTITATGTGTLHYQWKDDGSNVGTDSSSYTTAAAVPADNQSLITCVVTDDNGDTTSNAAIWTVLTTAHLPWIRA